MFNIQKSLLIITLFFFYTKIAFAEEGETINISTAIQKNSKLTENEVKDQLEKVFSTIKAELQKGRVVEIKNFGKFYLQQRVLKQKANPKDPNSTIEVVRKYPRFTSSPALKNEFNQKS
ncbi:MAG: HU family DNA-binding protein [Proteobacteria bacterium]|nr:HU family DNA-binding protein [Pseudomonadota bacterium]